MVYVLSRCTLCDVYVLKTLHFGALTLSADMFCNIKSCDVKLCCFTLCSNISCCIQGLLPGKLSFSDWLLAWLWALLGRHDVPLVLKSLFSAFISTAALKTFMIAIPSMFSTLLLGIRFSRLVLPWTEVANHSQVAQAGAFQTPVVGEDKGGGEVINCWVIKRLSNPHLNTQFLISIFSTLYLLCYQVQFVCRFTWTRVPWSTDPDWKVIKRGYNCRRQDQQGLGVNILLRSFHFRANVKADLQSDWKRPQTLIQKRDKFDIFFSFNCWIFLGRFLKTFLSGYSV
jgi:hypothetical protein